MTRAILSSFGTLGVLAATACSTAPLASPSFRPRASIVPAPGGGVMLVMVDDGVETLKLRCDELLVEVEPTGSTRLTLRGNQRSLPSLMDPGGDVHAFRFIRFGEGHGFEFAGLADADARPLEATNR